MSKTKPFSIILHRFVYAFGEDTTLARIGVLNEKWSNLTEQRRKAILQEATGGLPSWDAQLFAEVTLDQMVVLSDLRQVKMLNPEVVAKIVAILLRERT